MADQTLKEIALELLEKYKRSETTVVYEYGSDIDAELSDLETEYQKYKNEIETAAEKVVPLDCKKCKSHMAFLMAKMVL